MNLNLLVLKNILCLVLEYHSSFMPIKPIQPTRVECSQWRSHPNVNPRTKYTITTDGPTYSRIQQACNKVNNDPDPVVEFESLPKSVQTAFVLEPMPGPFRVYSGYKFPNPEYNPINKNEICSSECNSVILKSENLNIVTNRRRAVFTKVKPCKHDALDALYKMLHICEAPASFDAEKARVFDQYIGAMLHILYGDLILPVHFIIVRKGASKKLYHHLSPHIWETRHMRPTLEECVQRIRNSSSKVGFVRISCIIGLGPQRKGHAMILAFMKDGTDLHAGIIDSNFKQQHGVHGREWLDYLNSVKSTLGLYVYQKPLWNPFVDGHFQASESGINTSSLDREGFCAVWSYMIMEIMAYNAAKRKTPIYGPLDLLELPVLIDKQDAFAWKKLVIDYLYTRIVDMQAMARFMRNGHVYKTLGSFLDPYIEMIHYGHVLNQIREYVPEFDSGALPRLYTHMRDDKYVNRPLQKNQFKMISY